MVHVDLSYLISLYLGTEIVSFRLSLRMTKMDKERHLKKNKLDLVQTFHVLMSCLYKSPPPPKKKKIYIYIYILTSVP